MMRLVFLVVLGCCSYFAYGQQPPGNGSPCPAGMIPGYGKCYSPTDPELDQPSDESSGPIWQDRFGAFAVDPTTGSYGYASGISSKKGAFKAAIADCGGGGCAVTSWVRNGCLAAASGGISSYVARADLKQAEAAALERCSRNGVACRIEYSACSLPVRIR